MARSYMNNTKEREPLPNVVLNCFHFPLWTLPTHLHSDPTLRKGQNFPIEKNGFTRTSSWPEAAIYSDDMGNALCRKYGRSGELFTRKPAGSQGAASVHARGHRSIWRSMFMLVHMHAVCWEGQTSGVAST